MRQPISEDSLVDGTHFISMSFEQGAYLRHLMIALLHGLPDSPADKKKHGGSLEMSVGAFRCLVERGVQEDDECWAFLESVGFASRRQVRR